MSQAGHILNIIYIITAPNAGGDSILGQDIDFTKLLLKPFDSLDAIRASFSDMPGRHGRPTLIAWYDRDRD